MKEISVGIISVMLSDTKNNNISLSVTKTRTFSGQSFRS